MELKKDGIYLIKGDTIFKAQNKITDKVWGGIFLSIEIGFREGFFHNDTEVQELDSSIWDKAVKLRNIYVISLKSLINSN